MRITQYDGDGEGLVGALEGLEMEGLKGLLSLKRGGRESWMKHLRLHLRPWRMRKRTKVVC